MGVASARSLLIACPPRRRVYSLYWAQGCMLGARLLQGGWYLLLAYLLGPHDFGRLLFLQWLAFLSVPALGASISLIASRQIAYVQSREAPRLVAGIFYMLWRDRHQRIAWYCIAYLPLAYLLSYLLPDYPFHTVLLAGLTTLPLQLSTAVGTALRGQRRADLLALLELFSALLTVLLVLVCILIINVSVETLLLTKALASTLTLIMGVVSVTRLLPLHQARQPGIFLRERLQRHLKSSWFQFLLDALIWQPTELLLLAYWLRPEEIGAYILCTLFSAGIVNLAPYVLIHLIYPVLYAGRTRPRYTTAYQAFLGLTRDMALLATGWFLLLLFLIGNLTYFHLDASYSVLLQLAPIFLAASIPACIATMSTTYLAQHKPSRTLYWLNTGCAVTKIVLLPVLFLTWGLPGVALVTTLVQCASAFITIILCAYQLKHLPVQTGEERRSPIL